MRCPFCRHDDTKVSDSRATEDGAAIRRRRSCPECGRKFTTVEQIQLSVVKRSKVVEPFSRDKVIAGVSKACQGRPVTSAQLAALGQQVEEALRSSGQAEIPAKDIGIAILGPLAGLDSVAYLRFASVYKNYDSVEDFLTEISAMQEGKDQLTGAESQSKKKGTGKRRRNGDADPDALSQEPLIG